MGTMWRGGTLSGAGHMCVAVERIGRSAGEPCGFGSSRTGRNGSPHKPPTPPPAASQPHAAHHQAVDVTTQVGAVCQCALAAARQQQHLSTVWEGLLGWQLVHGRGKRQGRRAVSACYYVLLQHSDGHAACTVPESHPTHQRLLDDVVAVDGGRQRAPQLLH